MKKRGKNISNSISYLILVLVFIVVLGIGVYAMTAGIAPPIGHAMDTVSAPAGCGVNSLLKWTSSGTWSCIPLPPTCSGANEVLHWDGISWSCTAVNVRYECYWSGWDSPSCPCPAIQYDLCGDQTESYPVTKQYCSGGYITQTQTIYCCNQVGGACQSA